MAIKEKLDPNLQAVKDNLDSYIDNLRCLRETANYSDVMLRRQKTDVDKLYNDFIATYCTDVKDEFDIPSEKLREYKQLERKKKRAAKAIDLIPPIYIVSLVSHFDNFLAGLIRCIYSLKPKLLLDSNKSFTYRDVDPLDDLKDVKKLVIDDTIDTLFRDSHSKHFHWLESSLDINTLTKSNQWPSFIELTERRNLFVHSDGIVSPQYIKICKDNGYNVQDIQIGSKLCSDDIYFQSSCNLLCGMAIMLTFIVINKLYCQKDNKERQEERDIILINVVFDLICDKLYDVAILVSEFALSSQFKRNSRNKLYIELNLAQSYKWNGEKDKCSEILSKLDTGIMMDDFVIPKLVLEEKYDDVYAKMKSLGKESEILSKDHYRDWPIFQKIRKEEAFKKTFKEVFGEPLDLETTTIKLKQNDDSAVEENAIAET